MTLRLGFCLCVAALSVAARADPAGNTFVFLINGAENHSVLRSRSSFHQGTIRADEWDAQKIQEFAKTCNSCNVVLLHVKSTSYLQVFTRGKSTVSRRVREFNSANAHALSELLKSAEKLFPFSRIHLIYRAHSFLDQLQELKQGLEVVRTQLSSVTFACCSMAFLEVASVVSPYAKYMIATQTNVVETQDFGFDYSFLQQVEDQHSEAEIAELIADRVLSSFRVDDRQLEKAYASAAPIMESSVTLIQLNKIEILADRFLKLLRKHQKPIAETCRATKVVADRYIDFLKSKQPDVSVYLEWRWESYPKRNEFDLICFLRTLEAIEDMKVEAGELIFEFKDRLTLHDKPRHSNKEGLSFRR